MDPERSSSNLLKTKILENKVSILETNLEIYWIFTTGITFVNLYLLLKLNKIL